MEACRAAAQADETVLLLQIADSEMVASVVEEEAIVERRLAEKPLESPD